MPARMRCRSRRRRPPSRRTLRRTSCLWIAMDGRRCRTAHTQLDGAGELSCAPMASRARASSDPRRFLIAAPEVACRLHVPITRQGLSCPSVRRLDVATGPHPPPPVASTNPPRNPKGTNCLRGFDALVERAPLEPPAVQVWTRSSLGGSSCRRSMKRSVTVRPRRKRRPPETSLAAPTGTDERSSAPKKAPAPPAGERSSMASVSTLPCRWCARPETKVVPSCARCTEAEAVAGERPDAERTVDEVRP
mmetsp:Transcript_8659/g.26635  ORF Transcript_8659/g.26635 Transcript_8659/m.26635 type:complete len:249 (-) Transcript_8659:613-1359(-)|eukprot:scaffold109231_cov28-Tisochrysis_lutea.AAC.3